jgi:tetratricopeptide (TPR) repeat protein
MVSDRHVSVTQALRDASRNWNQGDHAGAAVALRRALDLDPTDPAVRSAVARVSTLAGDLLAGGRTRDALAAVSSLADSAHAGGGVWMQCGRAWIAAGRNDKAAAVFGRWLQLEPDSRNAALRLAAVLADSGKPAAAEPIVRSAVARHGESVDAAFVLGRVLLGQGKFDAAEVQFRKVVRARPGHPIAQSNLAELVWMRTGDARRATRALDDALRTQPDLFALRVIKARLLASAGHPRDALTDVDAGLARDGRQRALLAAGSSIALDVEAERALGYARRLLEIAPHDRATQVALGNASLATGRAEAALRIADMLQRSDPADGRGLALKADALRMLGDDRYCELLDYACFVRAEPIDVPPGWSNRDTYVSELARDLAQLHTLRAHPIFNSLRGGSQVELTHGDHASAAIRAFPQAIDGPIRRYLEALGDGTDPMRSRNVGDYRLSGMWSVRLRPDGFHLNHYHPQGWISSACYLRVPAAVSRHLGEGWLKFGEPTFPTRPALGPAYFVRPEPGLLALFPAYLWHGTVPFSGDPDDTRLTIAFDVVPPGD